MRGERALRTRSAMRQRSLVTFALCSALALALFRAPVIVVVVGSLAMSVLALGAIVSFLRTELRRPHTLELDATRVRSDARSAR